MKTPCVLWLVRGQREGACPGPGLRAPSAPHSSVGRGGVWALPVDLEVPLSVSAAVPTAGGHWAQQVPPTSGAMPGAGWGAPHARGAEGGLVHRTRGQGLCLADMVGVPAPPPSEYNHGRRCITAMLHRHRGPNERLVCPAFSRHQEGTEGHRVTVLRALAPG